MFGGRGTGMSTSRSTSTTSGTYTGNHGSMYTAGAGGGGYSHLTVVKFQNMPGGHGGGGGWARPTGAETSSISGRVVRTTADRAMRCTQGFIGRLLSVASD